MKIVRKKLLDTGTEVVFRADQNGTVWATAAVWVPVVLDLAERCGTTLSALRAELTEEGGENGQ